MWGPGRLWGEQGSMAQGWAGKERMVRISPQERVPGHILLYLKGACCVDSSPWAKDGTSFPLRLVGSAAMGGPRPLRPVEEHEASYWP